MSEEIYRRLAEHLDRLPGGFAPSSTGAELRLLQILFTPEEAALAVALTFERETAAEIAARLGLDDAATEARLAEMARKGLVFAAFADEAPTRYHAIPWVVGIYEMQLNNTNQAYWAALDEYWRTLVSRPSAETIRQMRTIPVGESVAPDLNVLPYEQVQALIAAESRFSVAPCICRQEAQRRGQGCDAPLESCLQFGEWADYMVRTGRGRAIERPELVEILARADAANLVLQPNNSQELAFICCCCACCCGVLRGLIRAEKPAEAVANPFINSFDEALCTGCLICVDRCPMEALIADGDRPAFNADRCIGCGLCVSTCPSGALRLVRKAGYAQEPPATMDDTWRTIYSEQAAQR